MADIFDPVHVPNNTHSFPHYRDPLTGESRGTKHMSREEGMKQKLADIEARRKAGDAEWLAREARDAVQRIAHLGDCVSLLLHKGDPKGLPVVVYVQPTGLTAKVDAALDRLSAGVVSKSIAVTDRLRRAKNSVKAGVAVLFADAIRVATYPVRLVKPVVAGTKWPWQK